MADTKTTALTEITAPVSTDLVYVVGDPGTTPVSRKATLATLRKTLMVDGWIEAGETWTYAAADAPTYTFTISGDKTTKYSAGMRLKLTDVTVKYFIVTGVSYGAPNTTVTVYGGTDYALTGGAITLPYYSASKAPAGFPLDVTKWTARKVDSAAARTQATPTVNVWYNAGTTNCQLSVPIGSWRLTYKCLGSVYKSAAGLDRAVKITLSTANNSESDSDWTCYMDTSLSMTFMRCVAGMTKVVTVAAKTTYYVNIMSTYTGMDNIELENNVHPLVIEAVCAYL